jgi:hypothetical protein
MPSAGFANATPRANAFVMLGKCEALSIFIKLKGKGDNIIFFNQHPNKKNTDKT